MNYERELQEEDGIEQPHNTLDFLNKAHMTSVAFATKPIKSTPSLTPQTTSLPSRSPIKALRGSARTPQKTLPTITKKALSTPKNKEHPSSLDFTFEEEIADSLQQNMAMETPLKKRKAD